MQSGAASDLSSLARSAQHAHPDLRPLLFRVQAQCFASAPKRGTTAIADFEAIALGLIPLVPDDVLSEVATLLRDVAETPDRVRAALSARLVTDLAGDPGGEAAREAVTPDLDTACDPRRLSDLVDAARSDPLLARDLLGRADLTVFDRAELYAFAAEHERDRIREELAAALACRPPLPRHVPAPGLREALDRAAEAHDLDALYGLAARQLRIPLAARFDPGTAAGQELLVCTLLAFGFEPAACIRAVLTLDGATGRSVPTVFRLAAIARSTPAAAAAFLAGCPDERRTALAAARAGRRSRASAVPASAGTLRTDGRADPVIADPRRAARASDPTVRAGHRSRSTTDPGRT